MRERVISGLSFGYRAEHYPCLVPALHPPPTAGNSSVIVLRGKLRTVRHPPLPFSSAEMLYTSGPVHLRWWHPGPRAVSAQFSVEKVLA